MNRKKGKRREFVDYRKQDRKGKKREDMNRKKGILTRRREYEKEY